jgi:tubulin---tyrosine ligase
MAFKIDAIVSWPLAPLTRSLVQNALRTSELSVTVLSTAPDSVDPLLQWSSYDEIDHDLTNAHSRNALSSSYIIRKALIRKHFLATTIEQYLSKRLDSPLRNGIPQTFVFDLSFADELDELLSDDLWELNEELISKNKWWILKP